MLIAEKFLEQGVAQVFDGKPVGARMALEDVEMAWSSVRLRRSDLRDALEIMVEQNCLTAHSDMGNLSFMLTERGAMRFYVCLYCEGNVPERLGGQRKIIEKSKPRSGLIRFLDRRLAQ